MSRKTALFSLFSLVICLGLMGTSPVFAGAEGTVPDAPILFPVVGLPEVKVTAGGDLPGNRSGDAACPMTVPDVDPNKSNMIKAGDASLAAGDKDGCPFAKDSDGSRIYFPSCKGFYEKMAHRGASKNAPDLNTKMLCCYLTPLVWTPGETSPREACKTQYNLNNDAQKAANGYRLMTQGIVSSRQGEQSKEMISDINADNDALAKANRQCFDGTMQKIGQFWAAKNSKRCFQTAKAIVTALIKNETRKLTGELQTQVTEGTSNTQVAGYVGIPSITGMIQALGVAPAGFIKKAADVANQAATLLGALSDDCGNIIPQLKELQDFNQNALGRACQAAESLVERHLTQCVRVNLNASAFLNLPQFSILLQCPVTIDVAASYNPQRGFNFRCNKSVNAPQAVVNGRSVLPDAQSMLSENGGLESLFDPDCFPKATAPSDPTTTANAAGTRIPGVDCGPLDSNPLKQANVQGVAALTPGRGVANGWAIGGSETVNGQTFTRCDFYTNGRKGKTSYVYGQGSSCNAGAGGFLNGGFETNTACYTSGGYTPAAAPEIPGACLYGAGCLDADGKLNPALLGTGSCSGTNASGVFDATRTYGTDNRSCADFDPNMIEPVQCCDPKMQDCRAKNANTPLCQCDEGDAANVITNTQTGQCAQGGQATCCSPRLNGGAEGCGAMGLPICADEANQCVGGDSQGSYTGPDGVTHRTVETTSGNKPLTSASLAASKPSPYLYLFIRPDAEMAGQQCCTTEWCNICPQHYVNAYGLSLARVTMAPAISDADNKALIGKGWPFDEIEGQDAAGLTTTSYVLGKNVHIEWSDDVNFLGVKTGERHNVAEGSNMVLNINENLKLPVSLNNCERATGLQVVKKSTDDLKDGMGWVGPRIVGHVPEPMFYPLDYLNRMRVSITDSSGTPLTAIPLCSDVKLCLPEGSGSVLPIRAPAIVDSGSSAVLTGSTTTTTSTSGGTTSSTSTTTGSTTKAPTGTGVVTPVPSSSTNTGGAASSSTSAVTPTTVPSASTGSTGGATSVPSASSTASPAGASGLY